MITPELAIRDLKDYVHSNGLYLNREALEIFIEFEQRCYKNDISPFYDEILAPLIKLFPQLASVIVKCGGNPASALTELDIEIAKRTGNDDCYTDGIDLYSSGNMLVARPMIIEHCLRIVNKDLRKEIVPKDILFSLLENHDEGWPAYNNAQWYDERLHTPFNTLSHVARVYTQSLWIKFEEIRKDFGFSYDLAISFAGEDRDIARAIAYDIANSGFKVFYDEYEKASLWGKDLYSHLTEIYSSKARYCLMIISKYYKTKVWTNLERQAAQARAIMENTEYILPLRIDDTTISGLLPTIGYIDLRTTSIKEIVDLIRIKLMDVTSNPHVV